MDLLLLNSIAYIKYINKIRIQSIMSIMSITSITSVARYINNILDYYKNCHYFPKYLHERDLPPLLTRATWTNTCCHVERVARTGIVARIVVSGSVVYRRAPTLHPLSFHPTLSPTARPIPPRNRETSKLHARKAVSCYLLDSRVATAPPCARKHRETLADGQTTREGKRGRFLSHENTRFAINTAQNALPCGCDLCGHGPQNADRTRVACHRFLCNPHRFSLSNRNTIDCQISFFNFSHLLRLYVSYINWLNVYFLSIEF